MFKGGVSPDDIEQGYLGNGYMLTVLSAMCNRPESIYDLFGTKEVNKAGIYVIYLHVNGVRTPVVIDDYIPVWPSNNKPVFAKAKNDELWVILVEKAWAKLHGTYCRTESSSPFFAASHLSKSSSSLFIRIFLTCCFGNHSPRLLFQWRFPLSRTCTQKARTIKNCSSKGSSMLTIEAIK